MYKVCKLVVFGLTFEGQFKVAFDSLDPHLQPLSGHRSSIELVINFPHHRVGRHPVAILSFLIAFTLNSICIQLRTKCTAVLSIITNG